MVPYVRGADKIYSSWLLALNNDFRGGPLGSKYSCLGLTRGLSKSAGPFSVPPEGSTRWHLHVFDNPRIDPQSSWDKRGLTRPTLAGYALVALWFN